MKYLLLSRLNAYGESETPLHLVPTNDHGVVSVSQTPTRNSIKVDVWRVLRMGCILDTRMQEWKVEFK